MKVKVDKVVEKKTYIEIVLWLCLKINGNSNVDFLCCFWNSLQIE